jgi:hypothetical protein
MDHSVKANDLRELFILARKMRDSAAATVDLRYIDLFMRAATALEDRASHLATTGRANVLANRERHAALHAPVSLVC